MRLGPRLPERGQDDIIFDVSEICVAVRIK